MKRTALVLLAIIIMAFVAVKTNGHAEDKPVVGFLSVLKVGQTVTLKTDFARYELTIMDEAKLGHKIIEVGPDYVVLEDISGTIETHIPLSSIKSIVKIKSVKK